MRLMTIGLFVFVLSTNAQANSIYQYKGPDGVAMFTDKKNMSDDYTFVAERTDLPPLRIEKQWSLSEPRMLDVARRDAYDDLILLAATARSEERRVGKGCRSRAGGAPGNEMTVVMG